MKKRTILVVDDDPVVLHFLKHRLESLHQYDVLTAKNGKEGLKAAIDFSPDVILMDVMMPGQSGGETVRLLKEQEQTREIPVIFMTVLLEAGGRKRFEINDQEFRAVSKPLYIPELLAQIRKALHEAEQGT